MKQQSAGILLYRRSNNLIEVFLVHPGGPFFAKKDIGVWSIPKGEFTAEEDPLDAARREFQEETGAEINGNFVVLPTVTQKSGKIVYAWAVEGDIDASQVKSNLFQMEWPPKSGKIQWFPEVDRGAWFSPETAREKIIPAQSALIDALLSFF